MASGDFLADQGLDDDFLGEAGADAQAGVANLADEIGLAAQEPDFLFFAKAEFAQAMGDVRGSGQLFDAHGHAGVDVGQGAQEGLGTLGVPLWRLLLVQYLHGWETRASETELQEHFFAMAGLDGA
jgi:hypothetical protein